MKNKIYQLIFRITVNHLHFICNKMHVSLVTKEYAVNDERNWPKLKCTWLTSLHSNTVCIQRFRKCTLKLHCNGVNRHSPSKHVRSWMVDYRATRFQWFVIKNS